MLIDYILIILGAFCLYLVCALCRLKMDIFSQLFFNVSWVIIYAIGAFSSISLWFEFGWFCLMIFLVIFHYKNQEYFESSLNKFKEKNLESSLNKFNDENKLIALESSKEPNPKIEIKEETNPVDQKFTIGDMRSIFLDLEN